MIFQLLAQICSVQPHALSDVETHVQATFSYPIDVWSLNEAQEKLERFAARKRGVFLFPIDKLHQQLTKVGVVNGCGVLWIALLGSVGL